MSLTSTTILVGDVRDCLSRLPESSVHCCISSPPYWGLRSYLPDGHADKPREIGLESSVDEWVATMVEVFRAVRRVLRDDGTLWLNLGDSYAQGHGGSSTEGKGITIRKASRGNAIARERDNVDVSGWSTRDATPRNVSPGLKPKDLICQPHRVAFALQAPQYLGEISAEMDRVWLAAMIDAEGCIYMHRRKAGQPNGQGYERKADSYSPGLEVANTSEAIVRRCHEIVGRGSVCHQDGGRRQRIYRWHVRSEECRGVLREVYPYLIAKKQQARIAVGSPTSGSSADAAHVAIKELHAGKTVEFDFAPPAALYGQGWWLRSAIVWSKLNPMPESITDRPTSAHEYVFLLAKSPRYFYDADAVREPALGTGGNGSWGSRGDGKRDPGTRTDLPTEACPYNADRNLRTVWSIPSEPFHGAHFATYPTRLVEPCVKAGSSERGCCPTCGAPWVREVKASGGTIGKSWHDHENDAVEGQAGGSALREGLKTYQRSTTGWSPSCSCPPADPVACTVLDPFGGSGTTALVANRLGRDAILCELNPEYAAIAERRIRESVGGLFNTVTVERLSAPATDEPAEAPAPAPARKRKAAAVAEGVGAQEGVA